MENVIMRKDFQFINTRAPPEATAQSRSRFYPTEQQRLGTTRKKATGSFCQLCVLAETLDTRLRVRCAGWIQAALGHTLIQRVKWLTEARFIPLPPLPTADYEVGGFNTVQLAETLTPTCTLPYRICK